MIAAIQILCHRLFIGILFPGPHDAPQSLVTALGDKSE
jgi:hypothetical protein